MRHFFLPMPLRSFEFKLPANSLMPAPGRLLVAQPFLFEPVFARTVIYICEHGENGTVGYVLNHPLPSGTLDLFPGWTDCDVPVFHGGPVGEERIHILHRLPELGGDEIVEGLFLGGMFSQLESALKSGDVNTADFKLLLGYSGWSGGQLEREIEEQSWYVVDGGAAMVFDLPSADLWKTAVAMLGRKCAFFNNVPIDPLFN